MHPHPNPASPLIANALAAMLIDAAVPRVHLSRFRRNDMALPGSWLEARQGN